MLFTRVHVNKEVRRNSHSEKLKFIFYFLYKVTIIKNMRATTNKWDEK